MREKHQKAVCLNQLKEHELVIGMLKIRNLLWDALKPLKYCKYRRWIQHLFESRKKLLESLEKEKENKKSLIRFLKQSGVKYRTAEKSEKKRIRRRFTLKKFSMEKDKDISLWIKKKRQEYAILAEGLKCASDGLGDPCTDCRKQARFIFDYFSRWGKPAKVKFYA
ncbi:uncharacterized protein LOC113298917 [Papaver somniferum]|uniref:uncharacterized protein LOC113298917 n=1 Tax=Papaver somniferum TaxID=3469 RepID=UPI000E701EC4|nr:uncharacterized protein LOC113298917 [Papaver somniferum]XP_026403576.1 uncharacterized protein LOC113298917 [Papaver somniferum]XP_026403577.1 uncharacterized protein LOC113298917 [Papaver somniferum]XP_026403578.1 uncharacterized protein LOC113298917 [Papaver somniferum]